MSQHSRLFSAFLIVFLTHDPAAWFWLVICFSVCLCVICGGHLCLHTTTCQTILNTKPLYFFCLIHTAPQVYWRAILSYLQQIFLMMFLDTILHCKATEPGTTWANEMNVVQPVSCVSVHVLYYTVVHDCHIISHRMRHKSSTSVQTCLLCHTVIDIHLSYHHR